MKLWAGLAGAAAVATGVTFWAIQSQPAELPDSKAMSVAQKKEETGRLLQTALKQQQQQNPQGAAGTYRRLLDLDPDNKFAWYGLGGGPVDGMIGAGIMFTVAAMIGMAKLDRRDRG